MPFGLKNAAQSFQRLMDTVCHGLEFVYAYIDDVLVASKNNEGHTFGNCSRDSRSTVWLSMWLSASLAETHWIS